MDSNGSFEFAGNGGLRPNVDNAKENGGSSNYGWQKVTNPKKSRRQENRAKTRLPEGQFPEGKPSEDSKVFQALEKEAEARRAQRETMLAAVMASPEELLSDNDSEGEEGRHAAAGMDGGLANGDAAKVKPKKVKKPKVSVAEAAATIDLTDLALFLAEISESFSTLPNLQVMRCADYFGRVFSQVSPAQFGWNKILKESSFVKAIEIPLCYLPENVKRSTSDWLSARPIDALSDFVLWALNDILNDVQAQPISQKGTKGVSQPVSSKTKVAVLVVLAMVLRTRPDILVHKSALFQSSPQYQGSEKVPMMVWAYGQAAQGDLVVGMYLWVHNLLPLTFGKSSTPISRDLALQFIEGVVFGNNKKAKTILLNVASRKGERLVPPATLNNLMHLAYPVETARTKATERFLAIYPDLKDLALSGSQRSRSIKPVAQQLLPLCLASASEDVADLINEACDLFIWCLSQNSDCYQQWEKLHLDNLKGSDRVLNYLFYTWNENVSRLSPLNNLKLTLKAFTKKYHIALEQGDGDINLLKSTQKHCNVLLTKISGSGTCLKATAVVAAAIAISWGLYEIYLDQQFGDKLLFSKVESLFF